MFKKLLITSLCALPLGAAFAADQVKLYDPMSEKDKLVVPMELLGKNGNQAIGNIVVVESDYGLVFYPNLKGLAPGAHGFHIHANADCGPTEKGLGMKAGGHWNPTKAPTTPSRGTTTATRVTCPPSTWRPTARPPCRF